MNAAILIGQDPGCLIDPAGKNDSLYTMIGDLS
jgi:hypothetical protein